MGFFSEILTHQTVGLIEQGFLFPGKMSVAVVSFIWNLMEYTNDHSPDAPVISTF